MESRPPRVSARRAAAVITTFVAIGVLAVAVVIRVPRAYAGPGEWTSHGPQGGSIGSLALAPSSPSTVYAAASTVFKTTNGATTWAAVPNGLFVGPDGWQALAVDPTNANIAYVGGGSGGGFKTTDGGASWNAMNGLPLFNINCFGIDPTTPTTVYAGVIGDGVYKSIDGGATWNLLAGTATLAFSIAVNPATPQTVYVGTLDQGVVKSTDGGSTWTPMNNGLTNTQIATVVITPSSPNTVYVGTFGGGMFKTTNGGSSWNAINTGLTNLTVFSIVIHPSASGRLYAGTGDGVFKTTTAGSSWTAVNTGLPASAEVRSVALDPTTSTSSPTLYATSGVVGIFKSTNGGSSWTAMNAGLDAVDIGALAIDPVTTTTLYAGSFGLFKSIDGSASWTEASTGLNDKLVHGLAVDPVTPNVVYATTSDGVYKSVNAASSWSLSSSGITSVGANAVTIDPTNSAVLYTGTYFGGGIFKSTNAGASWTPASFGLGSATAIPAILVDPTNPNVVYAATTNGVSKSTDGALHWASANSGLTGLNGQGVTALAIDPGATSTLYAAAPAGGVFKTVDAAATWNQVLVAPAFTVAVDPTSPNTVYVGSYYGSTGVYKSTNGGGTWGILSNGLYSTTVGRFAIDPTDTDVIYAGTFGGGVFDRDQGAVTPTPTISATPTPTATATATPVCGATPAPSCLVAAQAQVQAKESTPGKEKLKLQWKKITTATAQGDFGDPVSGTTVLALCLYNDGGGLVRELVVDRGGGTCSGDPCWQAVSTKGYKYKDKVAASYGITKVQWLAGGPGAGKAKAQGANNVSKGQTALPIGTAAALAGSTTPTIQFVTSAGLCVGASMNDVSVDDGLVYKAKKK